MLSVGDDAPDFTAPLASGDIETIRLSDRWSDGPVVLAFIPGAFTSVCSTELETLQQRQEEVPAATMYGVSVDTPFALNAFREELGLELGLLSDTTGEIIDAYRVQMDFEGLGIRNVARRAIVVLDDDGTVAYAWDTEDPGVQPNYDDVIDAVESL